MLKLLLILSLFSTLVLMGLVSPLDSTAIPLTSVPTPTPTIESETRCSCPEIILDASLTQVRDGDNIEFAAELSDENIAIPKYSWTVENGTIVKGQGTNEITVRAKQTKGSKSLKASVELPVYSSLCVCPTAKSISVEFGKYSGISDYNIPAYAERIDVDEERLTLRCPSGNLPGKETQRVRGYDYQGSDARS
jgi:hypothetical protein